MRPSAMASGARARRRPLAGSIRLRVLDERLHELGLVACKDGHHRHAHRDAEADLRQDHRMRTVGHAWLSISTPRLIGPGCMTMQSALALRQPRSSVRP